MEILVLPYNFLLVSLFLLPLYFFITYKTRKIDDRNKPNLPPGPPKLPIIGNLHQLEKPIHQALSQLSKTYGPVMLLKLGSAPTLVVSSAETAEQVLKTFDLDFCTRPSTVGLKRLSYNHLDIVSGPYGEYWREVRKICVHELLSTKRVQSFKAVRAEEVAVLIDSILSSSSSATPVDVFEMLTGCTQRTICRVAFGCKPGDQIVNDRLTEILYAVMEVSDGFLASDFFPKVGWIIDMINGSHSKIEKCFHKLDSFFQQMIDEHLNPERLKPDNDDIIDVLLKLEKGQRSTIRLTNDHIKAILMNVFIAGIDSSAATINWAMTEMIQNPEAMKKVQAEIRNYVGAKGKVEESDLVNFPYLRMVVKETLRLHTPGPLLIPRECIRHTRIDGYDVYPKTRVMVNVWAMGRNPKYWKNPEEFSPERFKDSSIDFSGDQNFEYIPFGRGRRGCPGINMGLVMTELALANVLYAFDWELPKGFNKEDLNMDESFGVGIHKKEPLKLVPIKHMFN